MDKFVAYEYGKILGKRRAFIECFSKLQPKPGDTTVNQTQIEVQNYCQDQMRDLTEQLLNLKGDNDEIR